MPSSNELDVKAQVARFVPNDIWAACRANAAGTKVIYTLRDGSEMTFWANERVSIPARVTTNERVIYD